LYRTPLALDSHFYALARNALIILAQLPAVLVIAAAFVLLVDPVLIIGVVTRMVLLCMQAQRPKSKQRDETWCDDTRSDQIWPHAVSPVLELSALRVRLSSPRRIVHSAPTSAFNSASELRFRYFSIICYARWSLLTLTDVNARRRSIAG
jgi:hypothetical protein